MRGCEEVRELIPWYVEGGLDPEEGADVATHIGACEECLQDVAVALRLRAAVRDALSALPPVSEGMWERVSRQALGRRLAQLDVGSFIVGFRLGAWLTRRGSPVRADLRLLGREVHLINRRKGGGSS
jgi:anti-sigma factor RsiW